MATHHEQCAPALWAVGVLCFGLAVFGGCRSSQQTAMTNPFLSADRVPPPSSKIPAVGTAQPYYPTDALPPLPATQPLQPLGALPPSSDITPIPTEGAFARSTAPSASTVAMAGDDGGVRIPTDEAETRFALAPTAIPIAEPQPLALASNTPIPTTSPPLPTPPTINNWPPIEAPAPQVTINPVVDSGRASGLFRDPTVRTQAPALYNQSTAPRVALPGAADMIREEVVPGTINTTSYQVGMAGGETGQPLTIPPPGYVPASFLPDTNPVPTGDGFRPRGSIRTNPSTGLNPADVPTIRVTPG